MIILFNYLFIFYAKIKLISNKNSFLFLNVLLKKIKNETI